MNIEKTGGTLSRAEAQGVSGLSTMAGMVFRALTFPNLVRGAALVAVCTQIGACGPAPIHHNPKPGDSGVSGGITNGRQTVFQCPDGGPAVDVPVGEIKSYNEKVAAHCK
jgi:hypothetical protein